MAGEYYKKGSWWVHCPVCMFKYRAEKMRKRWDGQMVCEADWEMRHPLDFMRARPEDSQTVPFSNKENVDMEIPDV